MHSIGRRENPDDEVLWAHAQIHEAQRALDRRNLHDAAQFAKSAQLLARRHDSSSAREAQLAGLHVESWTYHYAQDVGLAAYLADKAEQLAEAAFPRTRRSAHARLRRIEVAEIQHRLSWALAAYRLLADDLENCDWAADIRLAACYGAVSVAAKLNQLDVAWQAVGRGNAALRRLGDHPWERHLRKHEAQVEIRRGNIARADDLIRTYDELCPHPSFPDGFLILAQLHFADGQPEVGVDPLYTALSLVREQGTGQLLDGFLHFVGPQMPDDLRATVREVHDEIVSSSPPSRGDVASPD